MTIRRVPLVQGPDGGWGPDFAAVGLPAETSFQRFRDLRSDRTAPGFAELDVVESPGKTPRERLERVERVLRKLVDGMIASGNPTLAAIGRAARDEA